METSNKANLLKTKTSLRILIKNLVKDNIGFEGAQALIRIFDAKIIFLKIFWVVCLVGSNLICGYLLVQTLLTYLEFQVYTTTSMVHESPAVFPKITICNSALATTEYVVDLIKESNEEISPGINIFDTNQLKNLSWSDQENLLRRRRQMLRNSIMNITHLGCTAGLLWRLKQPVGTGTKRLYKRSRI